MVTQDNHSKVPLASIFGKRLDLAFDGGILTSDSGVLLLREVEAKTGILSRIIAAITDRRHKSYVTHSVSELVHQRVFQIACGYEDANDCDALKSDPGFKAACGCLPFSGQDLSSQPTMSRFENQMSRGDLYRIACAFVDAFIASYKKPPQAIILDIDDTQDRVYGTQQLSLFNGYAGGYCYQPLHIYEGQSGKLITTILRPGVRPEGKQVVALLKRLVAYLRAAWPDVAIFLRGDAHFSSPQVQDFCAANDLYFILGQSANTRLTDLAKPVMEEAKSLYAQTGKPVRLFTAFYYQAKTWACARRVICKAVELPRFGGEFMACVSILFLMQFFISYRRMVGDGRMPAMRIIPPFNVGEDSQACFLMCMERPAIDQLTFKGGEEALAQGVVIAVASRAHRGTYACFTATLTKCYRGILRALVRVVDHVFGTALVKCHVQSLQDQRTLQVCCHCPAHDAA